METHRNISDLDKALKLPVLSLLTSDDCWIEGEAVRQLEATAGWPAMTHVVGMPDLHPGKGSPIGAAFITKGVIYPSLVGNDIGCGMGLWQTDLPTRRAKLDRLAEKLESLDGEEIGTTAAWRHRFGLPVTDHDESLGTIGGGNHFAEVQALEKIFDETGFASTGLDKDRLTLLIHSGSRGLGESILRSHTETYGVKGLATPGPGATSYLARHDDAVRWAVANRARIAAATLQRLGTEAVSVLDVCHNSVTASPSGVADEWLHRKGAAPADAPLVVVPGSRGSLSYLVRPLGDGVANAFSLPHGAGRKWKRSDCRGRLERRYSAESLRHTALGGRVICKDKELLYEEAPPAYKNIETVVAAMVSRGLMTIVATYRPLLTFKKG